MIFFEVISAAAAVLKASSLLLSIYLLAITIFALKRHRPFPRGAPKHKFAVVIPARNEEMVIRELIESLRSQDYPKELFDIYVVPNNCTDNTAGAAMEAGAKIISCPRRVRQKGDALNQAFDMLLDRRYGYDAFCVFDADNIVDRRFLSRMNDAFLAGAKVAKGRTEAKNAYDSWVSGCYSIYFGMFNLFFNRARAACGLSAKLIGTAFAVHREILEESEGWKTVTIAEDAEFASQLAVAGRRVHWVPDAVAYDESPVSFRLSMTQRKRWCSGVMQVAKQSVPSLIGALRRNLRPLTFDFLIFMLMPFVQAVNFIPLAAVFLHSALKIPTFTGFISFLAVPAIAYYIGITLLAFTITICCKTLDKRLLKSIFTYALFTISWFPLQTASLFKKTTRWIEIKHTGRTSFDKNTG